MSNNRATFLAGIGGCLFGSMLPILLGAAQAPEKQFPRYSVSTRGERNQQYIIVDNQKEMLHLYEKVAGINLDLRATFDLARVGEKELECKFDKVDEMQRQYEKEKKEKAAKKSSGARP